MIGDGAVGLCAVIAAKLLGAERIILMGRHTARTDLGREFGATDVVAGRGQDGVERSPKELTGGARHRPGARMRGPEGSARPGLRRGARRRHHQPRRRPAVPRGPLRLRGVPAQHHPDRRRRPAARLHRASSCRDILSGEIHPGRVFDRTVGLDQVAEGYRLMNDREALKVIVRP